MLARGSEDVRDDIVSINTVNQPRTIIVDKPAGHLSPVLGVLAVVFLQAPGEVQKAGVTFWTQQGCTPTPRSPVPHVAPGSLTNDGNAKGRHTERADHLPGDRQLVALHHHCGICLRGVGAWVGVRHFIIKGVEELSWKGNKSSYHWGALVLSRCSLEVRELLACFFLRGDYV